MTCSSDLGLSIELRQVMGYLPEESVYQQSRPAERHSSERLGRAGGQQITKQQQTIRAAGKTAANQSWGAQIACMPQRAVESESLALERNDVNISQGELCLKGENKTQTEHM